MWQEERRLRLRLRLRLEEGWAARPPRGGERLHPAPQSQGGGDLGSANLDEASPPPDLPKFPCQAPAALCNETHLQGRVITGCLRCDVGEDSVCVPSGVACRDHRIPDPHYTEETPAQRRTVAFPKLHSRLGQEGPSLRYLGPHCSLASQPYPGHHSHGMCNNNRFRATLL